MQQTSTAGSALKTHDEITSGPDVAGPFGVVVCTLYGRRYGAMR